MPRSKSAAAPPYDVHPSLRMLENWLVQMKEKTGRTLEEWLKLIESNGPAGEAQRRTWLKQTFDLGTNTAWWLAARSVGKGEEDTPQGYLRVAPQWVEAMYAGKKSALRPLHDRLVALARSLGPDVKVCPCQTIVPLFRKHVFAQIKPASQKRIDLGLALGALLKQGRTKFPARLVDTGGFAKKDRITHRIPLTTPDDIDEDVQNWMRRAYDADR